jgi:uncharacterized protein (TIGR02145 family)
MLFEINVLTMKKLFFTFMLISVFFSCKKETSTPNINDVTISGFDCAGVAINGKLQKDQVASNVSVTITYSGGNGKTYLTKSHTSTGVTGLSATLLAGTLANGEGVLTYNITGIPNSIGTANFEISLGNKTCSFSIKVDAISQNPTSGYGANVIDVDGNIYKTVYIGTQHWMAENLKVSKYNDGTLIPNVIDKTQWSELTTGAWCYYNNDVINNAKFGKLYNWYTINPTFNNNKNVCPKDWHVPNEIEWTKLIDYLGGINLAGGKLKLNDDSWNLSDYKATNISLFGAVPGGYRYIYGFEDIRRYGLWWTNTKKNEQARFIEIYYKNDTVNIEDSYLSDGFSIRCIKD